MSIGCELEVVDGGYSILAPAKVNLHLAVGQLRADGYHDVDTVMVTVGLCDRITVHPARHLRLRSGGSAAVPAGPDNLCFRAARALLEYVGRAPDACGASITVDKRIPPGAGLGGGSADAAATLILLNRLWELNLAWPDLERIAATIGADVPFCLRGGVCRGLGTGTDIELIAGELPLWFVLAVPDAIVSTLLAYGWLDGARTEPTIMCSSDPLLEAISASQFHLVSTLLYNDFEPVVSERLPTVAELVDELEAAGLKATMSGSGPAVVGVTEDLAMAQVGLEIASRHLPMAFTVPSARRRDTL